MTRGKIRNRALATMLNDFSGLRWGSITPTDYDLFVEFGDRVFVFGEIKQRGTAMQNGQKLALERLARRVGMSGASAYLALVWHDQPAHKCPRCHASLVTVEASSCDVAEIYAERDGRWEWLPPCEPMTLRDFCDRVRRIP